MLPLFPGQACLPRGGLREKPWTNKEQESRATLHDEVGEEGHGGRSRSPPPGNATRVYKWRARGDSTPMRPFPPAPLYKSPALGVLFPWAA